MRSGGADNRAGESVQSILYCLVPADLATKLHEPLRRHFQQNPGVEVVVESRAHDRRRAAERRAVAGEYGDRRLIRNPGGRRVGDRRAPRVEVDPPALPRKAQRYRDRLVFFERIEPGSVHGEDVDTARLVTRIQAGDDAAIGDLYSRYFDRVYAYLKIGLRDQHEAEDATQQVFMKVLEALPRYERRKQPFRAWLFTIVRNHAIGQLKKRAPVEPMDPADLASHQENGDSEDGGGGLEALSWISDRELLMFIERLPMAQRQVLVLRFMMGLSHAEVAQVLGRSQVDVRNLQSRGLSFLRRRLTAIGRGPRTGGDALMKRWLRPARVVRGRRFALLGS